MSTVAFELIEDKDVPLARTTKWRLRKRGVLHYLRIGRRIYYTRENLSQLLRNCAQQESGYSKTSITSNE